MKRLVLALAILAPAAGILATLRQSAVQYQVEAETRSRAFLSETQRVAQARTRLVRITDQVHDLQQKLRAMQPADAASDSAALEVVPGSGHLTPSQSEQLLTELGFNWAATGDYLIVSKDTLRDISVTGLRGAKLDQTACDVLTITPQKKAAIESTTQALVDQYRAWAQAHLQREEPNGETLAKYTLPEDRDFSSSLSNSFAGAVTTTLGNERASLLLDYSSSWMAGLGLGGGGNTVLTVKRYDSGGEPHLSYTLDYSGNRMSTDVSPYQEFPGAFLPLFPNGWADLARHEGFALPKAFDKAP